MRFFLACLLLVPGFALAQPMPAPAASVAAKTAASTVPVLSTTERSRKVLDDALIAKNPDTRKEAVRAMGLIGPH